MKRAKGAGNTGALFSARPRDERPMIVRLREVADERYLDIAERLGRHGVAIGEELAVELRWCVRATIAQAEAMLTEDERARAEAAAAAKKRAIQNTFHRPGRFGHA